MDKLTLEPSGMGFHRISRCEGVDRCKLSKSAPAKSGRSWANGAGKIHSDEGLCGRKPHYTGEVYLNDKGCGAANAHGRENAGHPDRVSGSGYGAGADAPSPKT